MNLIIKGCYCDVLTDSRDLVQRGWRSNLIVQNCNLLLAALMKNDNNMQGILYLAIGEGKDDWDLSHQVPLLTTTKLAKEVTRLEITENQVVYLDNLDKPVETISNRLEITIKFRGEDFISNGFQTIREFGLFGGDAIQEPNSGFMINYVIHPRIDLTSDLTFTRKLRLAFSMGAIDEERLMGVGANLPVISIDGIGDEYADELGKNGIYSLGDLAEIDPFSPVGIIPQGRLRDFRAKARMVSRLGINLPPVFPLADRSISSLLSERPEVLAIDVPGLTSEIIKQLQEELSVLHIALDDAHLQQITLGDLIKA
ncbi:MAG: hypothetical protein E4H43_00205 [Bacteroidia bacterium]|nr:MAG: hypothetical protein E4H43_00205 [Bacteroidia bacterium]